MFPVGLVVSYITITLSYVTAAPFEALDIIITPCLAINCALDVTHGCLTSPPPPRVSHPVSDYQGNVCVA